MLLINIFCVIFLETFLNSFLLEPNIIFSSVLQNTSRLLFLQHATNKFENIYVPGFTSSRDLQA